MDNSSSNKNNSSSDNEEEQAKKPIKMGVLHLLATTLAAAIGVQSSKNLEQDFSQKSPLPFIAAGIIFTAVFLGSLIFIVKMVLSDT